MDIDLILEIVDIIAKALMILCGVLLIITFFRELDDKANKILEELKQIKEKLDKKD